RANGAGGAKDNMAQFIRTLHVASAAWIFGGALLIWLFTITGRNRTEGYPSVLGLMRTYEWGFWIAVGVLVLTGIGNLGHFGDALPPPESPWGHKLVIKLSLVLFLLALSALRVASLAVAETQAAMNSRALGRLGGLYGATVASLAGVLGLAVSLAHF